MTAIASILAAILLSVPAMGQNAPTTATVSSDSAPDKAKPTASQATATPALDKVSSVSAVQTPLPTATPTPTPIPLSPPDIILSNLSLPENSPSDTLVGVFSCPGYDSQTRTYSLAEPDGNAEGRFKIKGNQLLVANGNLLDYELSRSHAITVRSVDPTSTTMPTLKGFAISVTNVNESPTELALSGGQVDEHAPVGTVVGTLSAKDPDVGSILGYSFVAPNDDAGGRFKIVGNQIQVADSMRLDFETSPSLSVTVRVTNNGSPPQFLEKTFVISLNAVNESPTELALSGGQVDEHAPVGTVVGTLSAKDPDAGCVLSYSFVVPNGDAGGRFKIVGNQIQVADSTRLDFETSPSLAVAVHVSTNGTPPLTLDKTFGISLNDVNEPPSDIGLSTQSVAEHVPVDTLMGTIAGLDPDPATTLTYSFVPPYGDACGRFKIAGNQLLVASAALDYETSPSLPITIRATDNGGLFFDKSSTISLNDVNEPPANIFLSSQSVGGQVPVDTPMGTITGVNPDAATTLTYSLVGMLTSIDRNTTDTHASDRNTSTTHTYTLLNDFGGRFKIVGNKLLVANGKSLDYAMQNMHEITIRSTASGASPQHLDKSFHCSFGEVVKYGPKNPRQVRINGRILEWTHSDQLDWGFSVMYSALNNSGQILKSVDATFPKPTAFAQGLTMFLGKMNAGEGSFQL